jgi:hypothetical protein
MPIDLSRNGYPDLLICCHRNNLGHTVESKLYMNGPDGLDLEHPQMLLGYGPHDFTRNSILNAMDRTESEYYTSAPVAAEGSRARVCWTAATPNDTKLRMRVRFGESEEALVKQGWSEPIENGGSVPIPKGAKAMQYQAEFFAPAACGSPRLTRVEIETE